MPSVMIMTAGDPIFGVNLPLGGREPSFPNPSANLVGVEGDAAITIAGLFLYIFLPPIEFSTKKLSIIES